MDQYKLAFKKLKYIFLACMFLVVGVSFGQKTNSNEDIQTNTRSISSFDLRSKEVVGNSYIVEQFLPAIISNSEKVFSIRFNAYQDEMEFEKDGVTYYLPKSLDYSITFLGDKKKYRVFNYKIKEDKKSGFFLVLLSGEKLHLLVKERIKLEKGEAPKTGYDKYKPPTLKRIKNKYYIGFSNFSTKELPSKKKDFLKLFSSKSGEIESFMRSNKYSFKKEKDLIKIFSYFNTL